MTSPKAAARGRQNTEENLHRQLDALATETAAVRARLDVALLGGADTAPVREQLAALEKRGDALNGELATLAAERSRRELIERAEAAARIADEAENEIEAAVAPLAPQPEPTRKS
jgi:hypothetical protein